MTRNAANAARGTRAPGGRVPPPGGHEGTAANALNAQRDRLLGLTSAYLMSKGIHCAAQLGVADELRDGAKRIEELAAMLGCSAHHLHRLLMALSSIGIFRYGAGKFEQTALSEYLRRDHPESIWPFASFLGGEQYRAIAGLLTTIRTGKPCWNEELESPIWEYLAQHEDRGAVFDTVMSASSRDDLPLILESYDFSTARTIVDIGGGDGYVLLGVLERYPGARGILFDLPEVVARAEAQRQSHPARPRCELAGGDFFRAVPSGDVHILRRVLHDWGDDEAVRILRACRDALTPDGRVLVVEQILSATRLNPRLLWSDVSMMAFGGRERSVDEYERLLAAADLRMQRVIETSFGAIIEGTPAR